MDAPSSLLLASMVRVPWWLRNGPVAHTKSTRTAIATGATRWRWSTHAGAIAVRTIEALSGTEAVIVILRISVHGDLMLCAENTILCTIFILFILSFFIILFYFNLPARFPFHNWQIGALFFKKIKNNKKKNTFEVLKHFWFVWGIRKEWTIRLHNAQGLSRAAMTAIRSPATFRTSFDDNSNWEQSAGAATDKVVSFLH